MATPSGTISFDNLRTEIGSTGPISFNDGTVRDLIGRIDIIDMLTARSKTYNFSFNITSAPASGGFITILASAAGWPGTGNLTATVASGAVVNTLVINQNSWGNVSLINNGTIMGQAGFGGVGGGGVLDSNAFSMSITFGGTGLGGVYGLLNFAPSTNRTQRIHYVTNNGTIAGGGGGGGGGSSQGWGFQGDADAHGGGGGGGGRGLGGGQAGQLQSLSVINGAGTTVPGNPGTAGTTSSAGVGGTAGSGRFGVRAGAGGNGGDLGAGGANGANGASFNFIGFGGAGGAAIGGGNATITWLAFGTRIGAIL